MAISYDMLVYLFKYLQPADRGAASAVCKEWYDAAHDKTFTNKQIINFFKVSLDDSSSLILKIFDESFTRYPNYAFKEVKIGMKTMQNSFWDNAGPFIKTLVIDKCDINDKVFVEILNHCINLKALTVHACRTILMSTRIKEKLLSDLNGDSLVELKSLDLSENKYLTDSLVHFFNKRCENLEDLYLSGCEILYDSKSIEKIYPCGPDNATKPSTTTLTFPYVLGLIIARVTNLKKLSLSHTSIDNQCVKSLVEVPALKLNHLNFSLCSQITDVSISSLVYHQSHLRELDLSFCSKLTDDSLILICKLLKELRFLNLQKCNVTDVGIAELFRLTKLEILNISQCHLICGSGLELGISHPNMKELYLGSVKFCENAMISMSDKLPNLKILDVSCCTSAIGDESFQNILKCHPFLNCLKVSYSENLTDQGFTGLNVKRFEQSYSLTMIHFLKELDISGCEKITDITLSNALHSDILSNLDLSNCTKITDVGIERLVTKCPEIQILNLSNCKNITDKSVIIVMNSLCRLQKLRLMGCKNLSDLALEAIRSKGTNLKFLDIQGCSNISRRSIYSLEYLPQLHTVLVSIPELGGIKNQLKPTSPFLSYHVSRI